MSINSRQYERTSILVEARLLLAEEWYGCKIINISAGGARLLISGEFDHSEKISLEIGKFGPFVGLIAWQRSEEMGVIFAEDPALMADVVMGLATYN